AEVGQDPPGEGDVTALDGHAGRRPEGLDDGQERVGRQGRRLVGVGVDDLHARLPGRTCGERPRGYVAPGSGNGSADRTAQEARARRSAASTALRSRRAIVMGPTPPGMGASQPATSRTSGATSPTSPASVRVMPTSRTAAPGLTMSGVTNPARPTATTRMSASFVNDGMSRVPVWHWVTVALALGSFRLRSM